MQHRRYTQIIAPEHVPRKPRWKRKAPTMATKFCSLCKSTDHNTVECHKLKSTTHGSPRAEARPVAPPPPKPSVPRRPLVPDAPQRPPPSADTPATPKPAPPHAQSPPLPAPAQTHDDRNPSTPAPPQTSRTPDQANHHPPSPPPSVTKIEPGNTVTRKRPGPKPSGNALTPAQKQANYRRRRAQKGGTEKKG